MTNLFRWSPRLIATLGTLVALLMGAGSLYAADSADPPPVTISGRRLNALEGDVSNLRKQSAVTGNQVKQIEQAITVTPPPGTAAPRTIGEHVSVVEKDVSDLRRDLADNLGIHVHGLMEGGYNYNINQPVGGLNQLRVFDLDSNSFEFQQAELHIDRTAPGGVGFLLDLNFGKTAQVLHSATLYSSSQSSSENIDPTQAYLTYTVPVGKGVSLEVGKFVTLLGEEVIDTYNNTNFNISRSFAFGFGIPFTHTGIQASYPLTEKLGVTMALVNGWDDVSDNNSGKTVEGQLAYTFNDSLSMTVSGIYGPEQSSSGASKRGVIDPIVTYHTPIPGLQLIGEYLYGHEDAPISGAAPLPQSPYGNSYTGTLSHSADWQGAVGYIVYDLTPNLEFATRGEMFRDSDGVRTGLRQTLGEVTETINYKVPMVTGLLLRGEYRHDESNAHPFFSNEGPAVYGPDMAAPAHTYSGQDTLELQAVYTF